MRASKQNRQSIIPPALKTVYVTRMILTDDFISTQEKKKQNKHKIIILSRCIGNIFSLLTAHPLTDASQVDLPNQPVQSKKYERQKDQPICDTENYSSEDIRKNPKKRLP
jgi:hypothetical protein